MKHEFVALSSWSIDTDAITVVVACKACRLRSLKIVQTEDHDGGLIETIGAQLIEDVEAAVLEHAAMVMANRPGATTTPQTIEEKE